MENKICETSQMKVKRTNSDYFQDENNINKAVMQYVCGILEDIRKENFERTRSYLENIDRESEGRNYLYEKNGKIIDEKYTDFKWYSSYSYESITNTLEFPKKTIEDFISVAISEGKNMIVLKAKNEVLWGEQDIGKEYRVIENVEKNIELVLCLKKDNGQYCLSYSGKN